MGFLNDWIDDGVRAKAVTAAYRDKYPDRPVPLLCRYKDEPPFGKPPFLYVINYKDDTGQWKSSWWSVEKSGLGAAEIVQPDDFLK